MEKDIVIGDMVSPLGPSSVDSMLREAFKLCWLFLPPGDRTARSVEREMRRLFDRAIKNMEEDARAFGVDSTDAETEQGS